MLCCASILYHIRIPIYPYVSACCLSISCIILQGAAIHHRQGQCRAHQSYYHSTSLIGISFHSFGFWNRGLPTFLFVHHTLGHGEYGVEIICLFVLYLCSSLNWATTKKWIFTQNNNRPTSITYGVKNEKKHIQNTSKQKAWQNERDKARKKARLITVLPLWLLPLASPHSLG